MEVSMKLFGLFGALLTALVVSPVFGSELDATNENPQGVLMMVNEATGKMESFKVDKLDPRVKAKTATKEEMEAIVKQIAVKENLIAEGNVTKKASELDGEKATQACWGMWYGLGWAYTGAYFAYNTCFYRPYYYVPFHGYNCWWWW